MDDRRFTWLRRDYLLMPAIKRETCDGCDFEGDHENMCPNKGPGAGKFCYQMDVHGETDEDYIVIRDDPEHIADYVRLRLRSEEHTSELQSH